MRVATLWSAPTTSAVARPCGSWVTPACGTSVALSAVPSSICARTNMPGSRRSFGLGKIARTVTEPVPWFTLMSLNCKVPGTGYGDPSSRVSVTFAWSGPATFNWPLAKSRRSCRPATLVCVRST